MGNEIYLVTAKEGGDMDIFYYLFNNKRYYELFVELVRYFNDSEDDRIIRTIKNAQSEGLFPDVTDEMLDDIWDIDYTEMFPKDCFEMVSSMKEVRNLTNGKEIVEEVEILML